MRDFAAENGWQPGDYRLYVWVNETPLAATINLLLVARSFPGKTYFERWDRVLGYLEDRLKDDPAIRQMLHLVIRTFDQTAEGGLYAIGDQFVPIEEYLTPTPAT